MIINVVLLTTTLAIAASVSYALWKARRNESTQIRRVIGLALFGAVSIMLAKLVQLVILLTTDGATADSLIVGYADIGATIVVTIGIALLAVGLLDMVMIGRHLWPIKEDALAAPASHEASSAEPHFIPGKVPAMLFRREAPLGDIRVSSVFLNDKVEDLLGFTREEMQSDPHFVNWLMHPEDRQNFLNGDARLLSEKSEAVFDHRFKHRNGSYRWIRTTLKRIDDASGAFKEIVGCGLDITDLKEAEERLAEILDTDPCSVVSEDEII